MRRTTLRVLVLGAVIALLGVGSYAVAGGGTNHFRGTGMNGYEENPDVSTAATGSFDARLSKDGTTLTYELTYAGLEGTVQQAHIHFGKAASVNGGISLWLCQTAAAPAPAIVADTQVCPQQGTITGELTANDVTGPAAQGIAAATAITPGDFEEIVAALRAGRAYANVHSTKFPAGEIRAQLNNNDNNDD